MNIEYIQNLLPPFSKSTCPILTYRMSSIFFQYGTVTLSGSRKGSRKSQKVKCQKHLGGFPGGAVVENLPANAGDMGSSPGLGRSHMPWSNWAREPQLLSLRVWSLYSATEEAATVRGPRTAMKSGPRSPQLEKVLAQKRRPNTDINK